MDYVHEHLLWNCSQVNDKEHFDVKLTLASQATRRMDAHPIPYTRYITNCFHLRKTRYHKKIFFFYRLNAKVSWKPQKYSFYFLTKQYAAHQVLQPLPKQGITNYAILWILRQKCRQFAEIVIHSTATSNVTKLLIVSCLWSHERFTFSVNLHFTHR